MSNMTMTMRKTNYHSRLEGQGRTDWGEEDFLVLDDGEVIGRIHRHEMVHGERMRKWALQTYPCPPPNTGYESTLEDCKAAFKRRYEQVKQTSG